MTERIIRFLPVFGLVLGILVLFFQLRSALDASSKSRQSVFLEAFERPARLYLPSPLERYFLESREQLWPRTFHPNRPYQAEDAPLLFSILESSENLPEMGQADLRMARTLAVFVNAGHKDSLLDVLYPGKSPILDQWPLSKLLENSLLGSKLAPCSLTHRELLWRVGQLWPQKHGPVVRQKLRDCEKDSVLVSWFELQDLMSSGAAKAEDFGPLMKQLQIRSQRENRKWSGWFAEQALKVAELSLENTIHKK